jgi:hypothetical protein
MKPKRVDPYWTDGMMEGKASITANVDNVLRELERDPKLAGKFAYDEARRLPMLLRPLFKSEPGFVAHPLTDDDENDIQVHLQWKGMVHVGITTVHRAVIQHARKKSYVSTRP